MTHTIHILPQALANKIAAGEVVQRPASVIKELIENSLDAGGMKLTIIVKDGGTSLIQVIDDGSGMSAEDAVLSFERHATSKIATYDDLEQIRTLGFRGEALASIAAVSQVELRSRRAADEVGTKVRIEGGLRLDSMPEGMTPGTSISVRNLFYNTPGRRNFLKSPSTEFKHILDTVHRAGLAYPDRAFVFISNDETILNLQPAPLEQRVKDLFGEKLAQTVFSFEENTELAVVSGYLGKPAFARKTRTEQYLFLNKRYIQNRSINHAVFQAYEHLLEKGSFPFFVLSLTIDPHRVDVNVHPSKMEVKFADESGIYRLVLSSIRKALSGHDLIPSVAGRGDQSLDNVALAFQQRAGGSSNRVRGWEDLLRGGGTTTLFKGSVAPANRQSPEPSGSARDTRSGETGVGGHEMGSEGEPSARPLWQVHNKYIVVPIEEGLMLVDQHAAHERVLYEQAVRRFDTEHGSTQQLLFPYTVEMNAGDLALVQELTPLLRKLGFSLSLFGKTTLLLDGVPIDVKPGVESTILQDLVDAFKEDEHDVKLGPRERLAKSYSCKAAIKAGDPLKESEMRSLLDQLFMTEIPFVCPHGRPIIIKLSLQELDRRFGRTS